MGVGGQNCIEGAKLAVRPILALLQEFPNVEGILLLGGLGLRQYIDQHSDADIAVFLRSGSAPELPPFSFWLRNEGIRIEVNLTQEFFDMQTTLWSEAKRSAYRNAIIVYDPDGRISSLLDRQLSLNDAARFNNLVDAINQIRWRGIHHSRAAVDRGQPETAHILLNECVELIVHALYLLSAADRPHTKWRWVELFEARPQLSAFEVGLRNALIVKAPERDDVERRIACIHSMLRELELMARKLFPAFPEDCYQYWARYLSGRQVSPNCIVDSICDRARSFLCDEELVAVRGALSFSALTQPDSVGRLFDSAERVGAADPAVLKRVRALAEGTSLHPVG